MSETLDKLALRIAASMDAECPRAHWTHENWDKELVARTIVALQNKQKPFIYKRSDAHEFCYEPLVDSIFVWEPLYTNPVVQRKEFT